MKVPTIISDSNANVRTSGGVDGGAGTGRGLSILGSGISNAAEGIARIAEINQASKERVTAMAMHQQNTIAELTAKKTDQLETIEVAKKYSQFRTDWNKRLIDYQENPTEDILTTAQKEFDDYTKQMVEGGSSSRVQDELALKTAEFRLHFVNEVYGLQSRYQLQQFGATFDDMMSNAEDSIFATKSLGELSTQKSLMNGLIEQSVQNGRLKDPSIIQNLKDKVNLLTVSWAQSMIPENPEMVIEAIGNKGPYKGLFDGVSVAHRETLLSKATETIRTKDNQGKLLLREALQSDIVQRMKTGEGSSLNLDTYGKVYGPEARASAERDLANATKLYSYNQRSKGATDDTLAQMLEESKPKADPTSPLYGEQNDIYENVQKIVAQAMSDKQNDAFTYYSQSPVVKPYLEKVRAMEPANKPFNKLGWTPETNEATQQLQDAVLEQQKLDKTLKPYDYRIMPKVEAESFIEQFNKLVDVGSKADGAGVRDLLVNFNEKYSKNISIALNQINSMKGGEKVSSRINPLMWHVNNPSTFRMIVDSIRRNPEEQYQRFETDKVKNNFLSEVKTDKNFINYRSSVFSTNNSREASDLVNGVHNTFRDFARDWVLNGGKTADASAVFFAPYNFGQANRIPYIRPNRYTDKLGEEHVMSPDQVNLSNIYLNEYPTRMDPRIVDPKTILNRTEGFTDVELLKDTMNALRENTFWSTTEDETGVYMFTKGTIGNASRQVMDTNGHPIRVNFVDTMTPGPITALQNFGKNALPWKKEVETFLNGGERKGIGRPRYNDSIFN
jgi:hypothetical protein